MRPLGLLAALLLLAMPAGANTLFVGPGQPYVDIQAAIDAAQPDDVILVAPGMYGPITVDKPLSILADGSGTVTICAPQAEGIHVEDIQGGEELVISGMTVDASPIPLMVGPRSIHVVSSPGTVILHDLCIDNGVEMTGIDASGVGRLFVFACEIVDAGWSAIGNTSAALVVDQTTAWVGDSLLVGATPDSQGEIWPGVDGLRAVNANVYAWGTEFRGGDGSEGTPVFLAWANGGDGVDLAGTAFLDLGGAGAKLQGGNGGAGLGGGGVGGYGLRGVSGSEVMLLIPTDIGGGYDYTGTVKAANTFTTGLTGLQFLEALHPLLRPDATGVPVGGSFSLDIEGHDNTTVALFASFGTGPDLSFPGVQGIAVLDLSTLVILEPAVLDGGGIGHVPLVIPPLPLLAGSTLVLQGMEAFMGLEITNPAVVTITP